jgi:hypothetical protein
MTRCIEWCVKIPKDCLHTHFFPVLLLLLLLLRGTDMMYVYFASWSFCPANTMTESYY